MHKFYKDLLTLFKVNLFISILIFSGNAAAQSGVSVALGYGAADIVPIRFGYLQYWSRSWREDKSIAVRGYWELSFYQMFGKQTNEPGSNNQLQAFVAAGSFRFEANDSINDYGCWPYVDVGFGASLLTKHEISGKELGINYQFEDRIGFGARFGEEGQYELGYRFVHFSNAYLGDPNHGLNLHMLVFTYWL